MTFAPLFILAAAALAVPTAHADAYKCRTADGSTVISSDPCPSGSRTESVAPAEKITPEQKAEAERQLARDREALAERERARALEERRDQDSQRRIAEEESARRTACLDKAQREPDPVQRANLIAACQGVAPSPPAVIQQPVYVPVVPIRPQKPRDEPCPGGNCSPPPVVPPPPQNPTGAPYAPSQEKPRKNCQLVGGIMRCE